MPRALSDIMTELDSTYNPLRNRSQEVYQKGLDATNPQESADLGGLEIAKNNAFESINTGANRRGMFFSGIPLAEQSKYVGENYLPSIAGLKNRYAGIRGNLYQTLASQLGQYDVDQEKRKYEIYNSEVAREREDKLLADAAAERARVASSGGGSGGGFVPGRTTGGGGGGGQVLGAQETLRQRWQREATAGDYNAQTALNYAGDDGRYDGPVNSARELNILRSMGIQGNYYVPAPIPQSSGLTNLSNGPAVTVRSGGSVPKGITSANRLGL